MTIAALSKCELCGEPMPLGEEMFKYHGYSGPCPKSPGPVYLMNPIEGPSEDMPPIFSRGKLVEIWKEHGGAVDKKGHAWIEIDLLVPLLNSIIERAAPFILKERSGALSLVDATRTYLAARRKSERTPHDR